MNPRSAKVFALFATALATALTTAKSIKDGGAFNAKGVIGVALFGASATMVGGFAPEVGAIMAGLLLADVLVLPGKGGQASEAAALLTSILPGGGKTDIAGLQAQANLWNLYAYNTSVGAGGQPVGSPTAHTYPNPYAPGTITVGPGGTVPNPYPAGGVNQPPVPSYPIPGVGVVP